MRLDQLSDDELQRLAQRQMPLRMAQPIVAELARRIFKKNPILSTDTGTPTWDSLRLPTGSEE